MSRQAVPVHRAWRSHVGLFMAAAMAWPVVQAQTLEPPRATPTVLTAEDAQAWLRRIQESTTRRSFQGTFMVSAGGSVSSSRITHVCDGHDQIERVEPMGGPARTIFRHNGLVQTVWPNERRAVVEQRDMARNFPALVKSADAGFSRSYDVLVEGVDRVAGHAADVALIRPRDALRFAQRLWVERSTGLLLRAEVLNERGETIESAAFSDLTIGPKRPVNALAHEMNRLVGYQVVRAQVETTDLASEGWSMREPVAGFQLMGSVRRAPTEGLTSVAVAAEPSAMLQAIYSDGLTHVSLFIEPFNAERHRAGAPAMSIGATHALMRRMGAWWVTVVGDVPLPTLRQFAAGLERRQP